MRIVMIKYTYKKEIEEKMGMGEYWSWDGGECEWWDYEGVDET